MWTNIRLLKEIGAFLVADRLVNEFIISTAILRVEILKFMISSEGLVGQKTRLPYAFTKNKDFNESRVHLFGAMSLPEHMLTDGQLAFRKEIN